MAKLNMVVSHRLTQDEAVKRIKTLLGFAPEVSFAEGLRLTFDWYRRTYR